ncbi:MAG TPA: hypothetical protein VGR81_08310 [Candidatus Acidoferrales bacterium]|nr:hypothetical protein [Candidatus Acidoferrales bacterium]
MFAGAGVLAKQGHVAGDLQAGASLDEAPPDAWGGFSIEGGYVGPWTSGKTGSGELSLDYMASWNLGSSGKGRTAKGTAYWKDRGWHFLPFVSAGYTRLFGTGNALNYGGGFDYRLSYKSAIRVEMRDYYAPATPSQHNVALRIGWVGYLRD